MTLHQDKAAFATLLRKIADIPDSYRVDVLEKDYYVVLLLEELAAFQSKGVKAYFKGGTALYKFLGRGNRFSEDIDITVAPGTQRADRSRWRQQVSSGYTSLPIARDEANKRPRIKNDVNVTETFYSYEPVDQVVADDAMERFGKVKVEALSFDISDPTTDLIVRPLLYQLADDDQRRTLEADYHVRPFRVKSVKAERILVDKLFAAEMDWRNEGKTNRFADMAKHIYDLAVLQREENIMKSLLNPRMLTTLLAVERIEQAGRKDHGDIECPRPMDFEFFDAIVTSEEVRNAYDYMQGVYVLSKRYMIDFGDMCERILELKQSLMENVAWTSAVASDIEMH